jgi:hypothetical protein
MRFDAFFGEFSLVKAAKRRLQAIKSGDDTATISRPASSGRVNDAPTLRRILYRSGASSSLFINSKPRRGLRPPR